MVSPEDFRALALRVLVRFGKRSAKSGNTRLFKESLILSYYPERESLLVFHAEGSEGWGKRIVWCGIEDKPVASLDKAYSIMKSWVD